MEGAGDGLTVWPAMLGGRSSSAATSSNVLPPPGVRVLSSIDVLAVAVVKATMIMGTVLTEVAGLLHTGGVSSLIFLAGGTQFLLPFLAAGLRLRGGPPLPLEPFCGLRSMVNDSSSSSENSWITYTAILNSLTADLKSVYGLISSCFFLPDDMAEEEDVDWNSSSNTALPLLTVHRCLLVPAGFVATFLGAAVLVLGLITERVVDLIYYYFA